MKRAKLIRMKSEERIKNSQFNSVDIKQARNNNGKNYMKQILNMHYYFIIQANFNDKSEICGNIYWIIIMGPTRCGRVGRVTAFCLIIYFPLFIVHQRLYSFLPIFVFAFIIARFFSCLPFLKSPVNCTLLIGYLSNLNNGWVMKLITCKDSAEWVIDWLIYWLSFAINCFQWLIVLTINWF